MKFAVFCLLYSGIVSEGKTNSNSLVGFDCNDTDKGFECV